MAFVSYIAGTIFHSNREEIEKEFKAAIKRAARIVGGTAESYAKKNITQNKSVITGNLRGSITHKIENEGRTVIVGSPVKYAPFVELGTSRSRAKPYLRPALEDHKDEYKAIIEKELGG